MSGRRIRVAVITKDLTRNGITTVIVNYAKRLPSDRFEIGVLFGGKSDQDVIQELQNNGIAVKGLPRKSANAIKYFATLVRELCIFNPDIVHVNGSSALMALELLAASLSPAKARIAHCHNSSCKHRILNTIFRPVVRYLSTGKLACSSLAGNFVFKPGTFDVLPNAFEVHRFAFNPCLRERVRNEYGIPANAFVLGHVGRINNVKNQRFAVDVFDEVCRERGDVYIMFVGDGPDVLALQERIEVSPNSERIILVGNQSDSAPFYSAFDALLFPSRYEGLGITVLEAQASGLPCFISSAIPQEADVGGVITRINITDSARKWAETVLEERYQYKKIRVAPKGIVGFDLECCVQELTDYYLASVLSENRARLSKFHDAANGGSDFGLVSVIVPAYNAETTLARCIESVVSQDYARWELIVVDDGSFDGTATIADELATVDCRIFVIHQPNAGRSAARNRGIDSAHGDWVMFLDSDDYLLPDALTNLFPSSADVDVVWSGMETPAAKYGVTGDDMLLDGREACLTIVDPRSFRKAHPGSSVTDNIIPRSVCGSLYSRSLLKEKEVRFDESLRFGEDTLFNIEMLRWTDVVEFKSIATYFYDTGASQTCRCFVLEEIGFLKSFSRAVNERVGLFAEWGFVPADAPEALIAQETVTLIRRAARYGNRGTLDANEVCSTLLADEVIAGSLEAFKPNSSKRLVMWPIERFLLKHGFYQLVFSLERLR